MLGDRQAWRDGQTGPRGAGAFSSIIGQQGYSSEIRSTFGKCLVLPGPLIAKSSEVR